MSKGRNVRVSKGRKANHLGSKGLKANHLGYFNKNGGPYWDYYGYFNKNGGPYWDYYGYFNKRRGQCVTGTNLIGGCWGPIRL